MAHRVGPVLLLAGCNALLGIDKTAVTDEQIDAGLVGELPWFCQQSIMFDDMTATAQCGNWGFAFAGTHLSRRDGVLHIELPGTGTFAEGCTAVGPYERLTDHGAFVKVEPTNAASAYTIFAMRNAAGTQPDFNAVISYAGTLRLTVNGVISDTRNGPAPAWWRLRNPIGTDLLAAEVSDDGETWTPWIMQTVTLPSQMAFDIGAGTTAATTPSQTLFHAFGICQ